MTIIDTVLLQVYFFICFFYISLLDIIFGLTSPVVPYFLSVFLVLGIEFVEYMCIYILSPTFFLRYLTCRLVVSIQ